MGSLESPRSARPELSLHMYAGIRVLSEIGSFREAVKSPENRSYIRAVGDVLCGHLEHAKPHFPSGNEE